MTGEKGVIVVLGPGYWGAGKTVDEAKKNLRNAGGRLSDGYTIITFDDTTTFDGVDGLGRVHYTGQEPTERRVQRRGRP